VRTLREAHEAHVEDPFDPVEIAHRRIDHAIEWHHRRLDRLAVTELAGVVDLARALGTEMDAPSIVRLDALRTAALSTWPLDTREVYWALERSVALVEQLERTPAGDRQPMSAVSETGRPQASPVGNTDEEVTVHCDESRSIVNTRLDQSTSDR
jgi:hypothetical protein